MRERVHQQVMRAHVRAVPVGVMRKEDDGWLLLAEDAGDDFHRGLPLRGVFLSRADRDLFQSTIGRLQQLESEIVARRYQLVPARGLTRPVAALRHGDVDHPDARFPLQP
jgi:hypothetical protein